MSVNAAIMQNQRRINLGFKSIALLLGLGISPLILLWIDRPSWHAKYETPVMRQVIAWIMLAAGWAMVAILWLTVPLAAVLAWGFGLLSTTRRVAGSAEAPTAVRDFFSMMRLPEGWGWAWWAILGLPVLSATYNTVRLDFIPAWARSAADNGAILAMVTGIGIAAWAGVRRARQFRAELADAANLRVAIAAVIGAHPRVFEEGHASFHRSGDSIVIAPHSTVEITGVEQRLSETALGERYEVADKSYDRILLVPISETTLARIRSMRESGGLVQGHAALHDASANTPLAIEDADDDPWGVSEPVAEETTEDGVVTLGSEVWS